MSRACCSASGAGVDERPRQQRKEDVYVLDAETSFVSEDLFLYPNLRRQYVSVYTTKETTSWYRASKIEREREYEIKKAGNHTTCPVAPRPH
jgi:CTP:phosphocholine cytidylyltransferase-like protein